MSGRIWAVHSASRSRHKMNKALLKLNSMTFMIWQSLTNMQKTATIAWRMGCRSPPRPKSLWKNTLNLSVVFFGNKQPKCWFGKQFWGFLGYLNSSIKQRRLHPVFCILSTLHCASAAIHPCFKAELQKVPWVIGHNCGNVLSAPTIPGRFWEESSALCQIVSQIS